MIIHRKSWDHSSQIVKNALERAGLDDDEACFKSLRAAWASRWRSCGAQPAMIEWVGWGAKHNSVMERHYLTYAVEEFRSEIVKLSWPAPLATPAPIDFGDAPPATLTKRVNRTARRPVVVRARVTPKRAAGPTGTKAAQRKGRKSEREGFEPSIPLQVRQISSLVPSATRPSFRRPV